MPQKRPVIVGDQSPHFFLLQGSTMTPATVQRTEAGLRHQNIRRPPAGAFRRAIAVQHGLIPSTTILSGASQA